MCLGANRLTPLLVLSAAFLLVGCEAGNRNDPGGDNRWPGPELTIVQPGPGQVIKLTEVVPHPDGAKDAEGQPQGLVRYRMPRALFDLRNTSTAEVREGDEIWYSLDGGEFKTLKDPTQSVALGDESWPAGSHVLRACVYNSKRGELYTNPEATAVRIFHLGAEGGEYDRKTPGAEFPRGAFNENGPTVFVVGPSGDVKANADGNVSIHAAIAGLTWGTKHRVAYKVGDKTAYLTAPGPIVLKDLKPGSHKIDVWIQEQTKGGEEPEWSDIPGPFNADTPNFTRGSATFNVVG